MPEPVVIAKSFFELTLEYVTPDVRFVGNHPLAQRMFEAFLPWHPSVDDIESHTVGRISEHGFTIKLPSKLASFFVGPAFCRFTRDDVGWDSAPETLALLDAAISALAEAGGIQRGRIRAAVGIHIQPRTRLFSDLLRPLVPAQLANLEEDPIETAAVVVKWRSRKVLIDGSAILANAAFIRIDRDFERTSTYEEIAAQLHQDELKMFEVLDIEEDRR